VIADDTEMLNALKSTAAELGPSFGVHQYTAIATARRWPSDKTIADRLGTWNKANSAAGLPIHREEHGWSPERLTRALRALTRRLGRTPRAKDWDARAPQLGWPHSETVKRRLGDGTSNTRSPPPASPPHPAARGAPNRPSRCYATTLTTAADHHAYKNGRRPAPTAPPATRC
jgi:hypothetical protein